MPAGAGGPLGGAVRLLAVGLGALPGRLAAGLLASGVSAFLARVWGREAAGMLVFVFGAATLGSAWGLWGPRSGVGVAS